MNFEKDMELINQYENAPLTYDDVYIFEMYLLDNFIDESNEVVCLDSLMKLSKLFLGTSGFINVPNGKRIRARIFSAWVNRPEDKSNRVTVDNEPEAVLRAKGYIKRAEENMATIIALENAKNEATSKSICTISCACSMTICSICHEDIKRCDHKIGDMYQGEKCIGILMSPMDAYEWELKIETAEELKKSEGETVVFDFDGVINSYSSGWQGIDVINDPPVPGIKEEIELIRAHGYKVVVVSTRCKDRLGKEAVKKYLDDNEIAVDGVQTEKPPAICYIDDRAICFDGRPETLLNRIMNFKPWNK